MVYGHANGERHPEETLAEAVRAYTSSAGY